MADVNDDESFLSLEADEVKPSKQHRGMQTKSVEESTNQPAVEVLDAEIIDTTFVEQAGGKHHVEWPLIGMDCPDCASKAMRGLSHLKQVVNPEISATAGEIKLTVDLDQGLISQVSPVLMLA